MNSNFVRVFLRGEPVRWFDFPLATGTRFQDFVMQTRFEGFVIGEFGYIVHEEVRAMMLCKGAPTQGLQVMQAAGQA